MYRALREALKEKAFGNLKERLNCRRFLTSSEALADLTNAWEVMFPVERYKFLRGIVSRVTVWSDKVAIRYILDGLEQLVIGNIGGRKQ